MNRYKKVLVSVFGATLLAAWSMASAQVTPFYVGTSIGGSRVDACSGLPGGTSCDNKDVSWRVFGGYQFNRHFAVEIGYVDAGAIKITGLGVGGKVASTGYDAVALGILPLDESMSVFVKGGAYSSSSELTSTVGVSADESQTGPLIGFGAQFDIDKVTGVRMEWNRYMEAGGGVLGEVDLDTISIGFFIRF